MRRYLIGLAASAALVCLPAAARAAEAAGCDGFLWPLATELAWMKAEAAEQAASGATLKALPADKAIELALAPDAKVAYAARPTRTPKAEDAASFGGVVAIENPGAGHYQVTLSAHGWIDVVQNGAPLEATGHTGATGCDGIRKSVRFEIGPGPVAIQVSGVQADRIRFTIRPAAD